MSEEKPPDWLPDGWIMEVRVGKRDRKYRYYICPESGETFSSKEGVMRHLNGVDVDCSEKYPSKGFKDTCQQALHEKVIDALKWLPSGWLMEIRLLNNAAKAGQYNKCYINKSTGTTFYSKEDVLHFLSTGEYCNSIFNKGSNNSEPDYYVLVQIEYSPDGLPPGWIKETKFRDKNNHKDFFFRDPASGYVFRSMKDVFRYVEYGVFSRHAYQPSTRSLHNLLALEQETPGGVKTLTDILLNQNVPESVMLPSSDCKTPQDHSGVITDMEPVRRGFKKKKTLKQTLRALLKSAEEEESGDNISPSNACDE